MADKLSALDAGTVKIGNFIVNRLGFGAMRLTGKGVWGPPDDMTAAKAVLTRAVELDINFIDTADAYGPNISEAMIRDALYPYEGLIIATKGGLLRGGPDDWSPNGSPGHLREACEASLKRLDVAQINLYQFHRPDPATPFLDSIKVLVELQAEGKIRHLGLSNVTLEQLQSALELTPIVSVQNHYNLQHRRDSEAIVDFCEANKIAFIPYFPMAGGMEPLDQTVLALIATAHEATVQQIALAWLLARSKCMLPIPGTSSISHLEENVAAASIELTQDELDQIDALSD